MKHLLASAALIALSFAAACTPIATKEGGPAHVAANDQIAAGRYIVQIGGCNDCHTSSFAEKNGDVPESEWLTGVPIGYRGPWGTSYPPNLRLSAQKMSEDQWVALKDRAALPPMPWPSLHSMDERDLRAVYAYIKSLPVKGDPTPNALPPTQEPTTPYYWFMPITGKPPGAPG